MLNPAVALVALAIVAAFLGFAGLAGDAVWTSQAAFVTFLLVAAVSFLVGRRVLSA